MRSLANGLPDLVRVTMIVLPADCWPMMIRRCAGVTMIWMDPRASRRTLTELLVLRLDLAELALVRDAYGQAPTGPLEEWTQNDRPRSALLYVPEQLRMRGARALQGGDELRRRAAAGDLDMEWACLVAEGIVPMPVPVSASGRSGAPGRTG